MAEARGEEVTKNCVEVLVMKKINKIVRISNALRTVRTARRRIIIEK